MLFRTTSQSRRRSKPGARARRFRRGFTLIEAAIVTVLIGVGCAGVMQLLAAGTVANAESTKLTTALGLAGNIHERAIRVNYGDLFATFNDKTFSPPIDATGAVLTNFNNWTQVVDVKYVDPSALTSTVPDAQIEPTAQMSVLIRYKGKSVYQTTWLVAAPQWPLP
jgi:type II secretory pathway pseudopilin PulG